MRKLLIVLTVLFFISVESSYSQEPWSTFRFLNFECGGYVTAVFPMKGSFTSSNQILYAKTDVGGVYRSDDNGVNWHLVTCYYRGTESQPYFSSSELVTATVAIHPTNPNIVIMGWGQFHGDASTANFECLWKSTDGGMTFPIKPSFGSNNKIWFQGDNFERKIGGECLIYDPNDPNIMYVGGIPKDGESNNYLYKSIDGGSNFSMFTLGNFPASNTDTVTCIAMVEGSNEIWVGTSTGIFRSTNGTSFSKIVDPTNLPNGLPYVRRILLKKDASTSAIKTAIIAYGKDNAGDFARYDDGTWTQNLYFPNDIHSPTQTDNYTCLLTWTTEINSQQQPVEVLVAGRWNRPIKKSYDLGDNWVGESGFSDIRFDYKTTSPNNYPNHQFLGEQTDFIYTGLNQLVKNPNNHSSLQNTWYVSGGAGLRISDNQAPSNTNLFEVSSNNYKLWDYSTYGQKMTVVYDVAFEPGFYSYTMIPIADWTLAYTTNDGLNFSELTYENRITPSPIANTYIGNVSRSLFSTSGTATTYNLGGDVYNGLYPSMYKRVQGSTVQITGRHRGVNSDGLYSEPNRFIVDAINFNNGGSNDRLVILVGAKDKTTYNATLNYFGVYYSDNEGESWNEAAFDMQSLDNNLNTQTQIEQSILPGLSGDIDGYFSSQFNLCKGPAGYYFLYIEKGGMFVSSNGGANWASVTGPVAGYWGEGCLKYIGNDKVALAIRRGQNNGGLYEGTITTGSNFGISWTTKGGFTSARQVEVKGNVWTAFGMRTETSDNVDRLYKSTNSGVNWTLINGKLPSVRSLRIHPQRDNELWISTSGQGVIVYDNLQDATNPPPLTISSTINFPNSVYFDRDIIIESGGELIADGTQNQYNHMFFEMGKNRKIRVEAGGKFTAKNVTFQSRDTNYSWGGITYENASISADIDNCTFKHFSKGITFDYTSNLFSSTPHYINNSTFIVKFDGSRGIYAKNTHKLVCTGNTFNIWDGSNKAGVIVQNWLDENVGDGLPGGGPQIEHQMNFVSNTFTGGALQLFIGGYTTNPITCYVASNSLSSSKGLTFGGRLITGDFKNNLFGAINSATQFGLWQSEISMYKNTLTNTTSTGDPKLMYLNSGFARMEPIRSGGNLIWSSGLNSLSNNLGDNISIDAGFPYIQYGRNSFTISNSQAYHLYGHLSDSVFATMSRDFPAVNNCWYGTTGNIPKSYLFNNTVNPINVSYQPVNSTCPATLDNPTASITDLGFGFYDTVYSTTDNLAAPPNDDYQLNSQALEYMDDDLWVDAITAFKNLIDDHPNSTYTNGCLYDLYDCHVELDTSGIQNNTDIIFGSLRDYLVDKMNSSNYDKDFNDIAYQVILLCEENMNNLEIALEGYEFIALFHPDPETRLFASIDYAQIDSLLNGGQGGGLSSKMTSQEMTFQRYKKFDKLFDDRPLLKKLKEQYEKETQNNSETKNISTTKEGKIEEKTFTSKLNLKEEGRQKLVNRAMHNLNIFNTLSPEEKEISRMDDIFALIGLETQGSDNNGNPHNLPFKYELAQNYPNPFNPTTTIQYSIPKDLQVRIKVYDIVGREMATLVNELQKPGIYSIQFDGSRFASGVYFYRIIAGDFVETKRMVLVK